jgi:hypothetical protein
VSALVDKKTVMRYYREATEEPYSFLYCRLEAKRPEDIFWIRFEYRLVDRDVEPVVHGRAAAV